MFNQIDTLTRKNTHTHLRGLGEDEFGVLDQTLQRHSDVNDLCFLLLLAGVWDELAVPGIQDDQSWTHTHSRVLSTFNVAGTARKDSPHTASGGKNMTGTCEADKSSVWILVTAVLKQKFCYLMSGFGQATIWLKSFFPYTLEWLVYAWVNIHTSQNTLCCLMQKSSVVKHENVQRLHPLICRAVKSNHNKSDRDLLKKKKSFDFWLQT